MISWITDYVEYVKKHPNDFNKHIKNNVRQIEELISRPDIEYKSADPTAFEKMCRFFKHREGILAGQPLVLNMEQRYITACILGIKEYSQEYKRWIRYFTETDLFVARKWGKDHFIAPLILWFLGLDNEPSAWGQIVAENSKQAERTFEIVQKAILCNPFNSIFVKKGARQEKKILSKPNDGKLEYLSGRTKGKDGSNPSFGVCNEAHEITNLNQYNALKTGMGARMQPMMIVISSAGITPDSLYEKLYDRNESFLRKDKLEPSDRIFAMMYGIDEDDDIEDDSCWIKANPAMYEGRPTLKFLREQWASMKNDPEQRGTFISKHLNRNIGAAMSYYSMDDLKKCASIVNKEDFYNSYATGGVDLSNTTDLTNATAKILTKTGKTILLQAYFIAQERLLINSKKDRQSYDKYTDLQTDNDVTSKVVIVTPGSTVDYHYVTQWFCNLRDNYKVNFLKIGYDKAMSNYWVADMVENGFDHEKVTFDKDLRVESRDFGVLTPCYQGIGLDEAIRISRGYLESNKYIYDKNNKLLPYCFYSCKVQSNNDNKLSVSKAKSNGHIDGCIGVFNSEISYIRAKEIYNTEDCLSEYFRD